LGTRRSTTGLVSADLGERSNERRGRAPCAAADGGELGSDLKGPAPLERERGVDGVPMLLLLVPPGVEGRWLDDGVEGRWLDDGVEGRWLDDGVLGLPLLLMGDSFGPDLPMATSIKNRRKALLFFLFLLLCRLRWRIENDERSEITQLKAAKASSFFFFFAAWIKRKPKECTCKME
jgi:hypothetical protein